MLKFQYDDPSTYPHRHTLGHVTVAWSEFTNRYGHFVSLFIDGEISESYAQDASASETLDKMIKLRRKIQTTVQENKIAKSKITKT